MAKVKSVTTSQSKSSVAEKTAKNGTFSGYFPYIAAFISFAVITFIFFSPMLTEDKLVYQGDIVNYIGMSHELQQYRAEKHSEALWSNSMFGGMPAFQLGI